MEKQSLCSLSKLLNSTFFFQISAFILSWSRKKTLSILFHKPSELSFAGFSLRPNRYSRCSLLSSQLLGCRSHCSAFCFQHSVFSSQLSVFGTPLAVVSSPLLVFSSPLSIFSTPLLVFSSQLSLFSSSPSILVS